MTRFGIALLIVIAGCARHAAQRHEVVVPDSLVRSGLLLQNRGDTAFELLPRWSMRDEMARPPEGSVWVLDKRRAEHIIGFGGYDSSVIRIDGRRLVPRGLGVTPLVVRHADVVDTIRVVVGMVRAHLVATFDSTTLPDRRAYHASTWDTVGGWARHRMAQGIAIGTSRSAVHGLLGKPRATCLTVATGTVTDSWGFTTTSAVVVQTLADTVVRTYVASHDGSIDAMVAAEGER